MNRAHRLQKPIKVFFGITLLSVFYGVICWDLKGSLSSPKPFRFMKLARQPPQLE